MTADVIAISYMLAAVLGQLPNASNDNGSRPTRALRQIERPGHPEPARDPQEGVDGHVRPALLDASVVPSPHPDFRREGLLRDARVESSGSDPPADVGGGTSSPRI
jgi:hypothetical protein